jgi:hypothetical protein
MLERRILVDEYSRHENEFEITHVWVWASRDFHSCHMIRQNSKTKLRFR